MVSVTLPDLTGLPHDLIRVDGADYMRRYFLRGRPRSNSPTVRYHQILTSDGQHLHDHPWDYTSHILQGRYIEHTPQGATEYGPGSVLRRRAEWPHRLTLPDGPVWTRIHTGPARRQWGFHTDDGWIPWRTYTRVAPTSRSW